jgi:hypothetical protein
LFVHPDRIQSTIAILSAPDHSFAGFLPSGDIMNPARLGVRVGLGLALSLLIFTLGCGQKATTTFTSVATVIGEKPKGDAPASNVDPALMAFVPADYAAFALMNFRASWESPNGQKMRKLLENMEDGKALKEMEEETGMAPGDIGYLGFVMLDLKGSEPIIVVSNPKPYDLSKVRQSISPDKNRPKDAPKSREEEYKGKKLIVQPLLTFSEVGQTIGGPVEKGPPVKDRRPKDKIAPPQRAPAPPDSGKAPARTLALLSDRTFAVGMDKQIRAWIDRTESSEAKALSASIVKLGEKHHFVGGIKRSVGTDRELVDWTDGMIDPGRIPPALKPLLKMKGVRMVGDWVDSESRIQVKVDFPDDSSAQEGEKAMKAGLGMLAVVLPSIADELEKGVARDPGNPLGKTLVDSFKEFQNALSDMTPQRDGSTISLALAMKTAFPEVTSDDLNKMKFGALRTKHSNNAKQIGLAFHNWASTYGDGWPPAAICDKDGKPLLSWRVAILPYIEQNSLYREFKLNEPWDSPHNIKLLDRMPKVYRLPGANEKDTHYQLLVGPKTLYPDYGTAADAATSARKGIPMGLRGMLSTYSVANIPDGTSNTILVIESNNGVPWTKPEDVRYDPQQPLPKFGNLVPEQFLVVMADGSVRFVSMKVSEKTLRSAIDPTDGMPLGSDW